MVVKMEDNQLQLMKCIPEKQQKVDTEMDQWSKDTKRMITEEFKKKVDTSVVSEVWFLVQ